MIKMSYKIHNTNLLILIIIIPSQSNMEGVTGWLDTEASLLDTIIMWSIECQGQIYIKTSEVDQGTIKDVN